MEPQPIIIQIGCTVPVMTYEEFSKLTGLNERTIETRVAAGLIPIMPKTGNQKPLVNLAKYWQIALGQVY